MAVYEWKVGRDFEDYREAMTVLNRRRKQVFLPVLAAVELTIMFLGAAGYIVGIFAFVLAAFALLWYILWPSLLAKRTWKTHGMADAADVTVYRLTEDAIECSAAKGHSVVEYSAICGLAETENLYLLYTAPARAFYLPKQAFESGLAEDFKNFLAEKTGQSFVKKDSYRRDVERHVMASVAAVAAAFLIAVGVAGMGYAKRPVTFTTYSSQNEATTCTVSLPYFLRETPSFGSLPLYTGNGITVSAEYFSNEQIQWKFDNVHFAAPVNVKNFASFQKRQSETHPQVDWVEDTVRKECYVQYDDGGDYFYRVLHATEGGCWQLTFTCPGERQDTYYNRFNDWRLKTEYN